jgi:nicotinamidase/pyrazinamidase
MEVVKQKWSFEMNKHFIIVVDAQNDFMHSKGALYVPESESVINNINQQLKQQTYESCAGILFTFDTHDKETYATSEEAKDFPPHCYLDTEGWNLAVDPFLISSEIPIYVLRKNLFDMWKQDYLFVVEKVNAHLDRSVSMHSRDPFFQHLKLEGNGRVPIDKPNAGTRLPLNKIVIMGVAADICVSFAIKGAKQRGFEVEVPANTSAGIHKSIEQVLLDLDL